MKMNHLVFKCLVNLIYYLKEQSLLVDLVELLGIKDTLKILFLKN